MRALLELVAPSVCPACDRARAPGQELLCPACAVGLTRQDWLGTLPTAIAYTETGARLLQRFKFEHRRDGLPLLLALLERRAAALGGDAVVPVPRHIQRIREQGSDPAFTLARALARRTGRALCADALARTRETPTQTSLARDARLRGPGDSLCARAGALRGLDVLLLDDVATTGATLRAAASALRRAQPRRVVALALAGTPERAANAL